MTTNIVPNALERAPMTHGTNEFGTAQNSVDVEAEDRATARIVRFFQEIHDGTLRPLSICREGAPDCIEVFEFPHLTATAYAEFGGPFAVEILAPIDPRLDAPEWARRHAANGATVLLLTRREGEGMEEDLADLMDQLRSKPQIQPIRCGTHLRFNFLCLDIVEVAIVALGGVRPSLLALPGEPLDG